MTANPWLKPSPYLISLLCIIPIILLPAAAIAQNQPPIFPISNTLPIGAVSTPAIGDFNGDGQPDLIYSPPPTSTPSQQFATLTVLLNQGAANPTPIVTSSLNCTSVTSLMVADMNNDKKLDVVLTCTEGFVAVLFGNGDGTFQKPAYYAVHATSVLIFSHDLNADGFTDVVVSNPSSVIVLLNQGSNSPGTLSSPISYPAPPIQFHLIGVGDFNGDGKPDLLGTANADIPGLGFQLITYAGNGDGTFQSPQTQSTTTSAGAAVIAGVNHDGFSDVVYIANPPAAGEPQLIQVLLGNSTGQFTLGSSLSLDPSINYTSLALAGSTNNGANINLALGSQGTTILVGDGKGSFTPGQTYAIAGSPLPETGSNGNTNLVFFTPSGVTLLPGNGDGTFKGLPNLPVGHGGFFAADFNRDGLTDIAFISDNGNLTTAVGRGNGTLAITSQIAATAGEFLLAADFNGDGRPDVVAILPGVSMQEIVPDSQLFFYKGNGDGTFQPASAAVDLLTSSAIHAITGDFNGDGHLDLVVSFIGNQPNQGESNQAIIAFPGNGDGTFGTPVLLATQSSFNPASSLVAADLNNDKRTDLIWNNIVFLGQSDGSFLQQPLGLLGTPLAIGDLNGDGIPDIVVQPPSVAGSTPGFAVYAGVGDGTFQTTPLFTKATLPQSTTVLAALIGDVNADGKPDLLVETQDPNSGDAIVSVYLGDGKGNFTSDPNIYTAGHNTQDPSMAPSPIATFARLNNQAPALSGDNALDLLTFTSGGATSLLNQSNPTPSTPVLLPSTTTLSAFPVSVAPTQPVMLVAGVAGATPTGTVSFISAGVTLGTASIRNGTASITVSLPAPGTYAVTASYMGNGNNQASSSSPFSITVAQTPSTTLLGVDTLTPGANQVFHFVVGFGGYSPTGTVTFLLADGTSIGTTQAVGGQASFAYFFPIAGTYTVHASYAGDAANLPSISSPVTITVMPQDFTLSSSGDMATLIGGQGATGTLTIIPTYGYSGTVNLSCSQLVAGEACSFTPPSVRSLDGFTQVSSVFVITTTASNSTKLRKFLEPLDGIAFAGLFGMLFFRKRVRRAHRYLLYRSLLALLLTVSILQIVACSSSPAPSQTSDPNAGTPKGTHTFVITAADSAGGPSHTVSITLIVD